MTRPEAVAVVAMFWFAVPLCLLGVIELLCLYVVRKRSKWGP